MGPRKYVFIRRVSRLTPSGKCDPCSAAMRPYAKLLWHLVSSPCELGLPVPRGFRLPFFQNRVLLRISGTTFVGRMPSVFPNQ